MYPMIRTASAQSCRVVLKDIEPETDESIYRFLLLLCKSKANEYLIWVVGETNR